VGLYLRDPEISLHTLRRPEERLAWLVMGAESWLTVLSHAVQLHTLAALCRAARMGVEAELILSAEAAGQPGAEATLANVAASGVAVSQVDRLAVQLGLSEQRVLCRSATGRGGEEIELGLEFPSNHRIHAEAVRFLERDVRPRCRPVPDLSRWSGERPPLPVAGSGHCLRCGGRVALQPLAPYCRADYTAWALEANPYHLELFCHGCGERSSTTWTRPLCASCEEAWERRQQQGLSR
jgi:hypothetical protein